jgi:hypothetical protein
MANPYGPPPFQAPPPQPPQKKSGAGPLLLIGGAAVVVVAVIVAAVVVVPQFLGPQTRPAPTPTLTPAPTVVEAVAPTQTPEPESAYNTFNFPETPVPYPREVLELDEKNKYYVGQLQKGDCVSVEPIDASWYESETLVAPVVDCSEPHANQVAGFVDFSDQLDIEESEMNAVRRCNSLIGSIPAWDPIEKGVNVHYPEPEKIAEGYTVALCWLPIFGRTWVGSAVDGTGELVDG